MQINYINGDILMDVADGIVIPVNTVGVPGAGLARQWAKRYPRESGQYIAACLGDFQVGSILAIRRPIGRYFLCFPTKKDWRNPSRMEYVRDGLHALSGMMQVLRIRSVAIPALGCGLGGLQWDDVHPLILETMGALDIQARLYPPK